VRRLLVIVGMCIVGTQGCSRVDSSHQEAQKQMEHAVLVEIPITKHGFGTSEEQESVIRLEDALSRALAVDPTIEVDGHEFGDGKATLYIYGRDADEMFRIAKPELAKHPSSADIVVTRRYGPATDPKSKELVTGL